MCITKYCSGNFNKGFFSPCKDFTKALSSLTTVLPSLSREPYHLSTEHCLLLETFKNSVKIYKHII